MQIYYEFTSAAILQTVKIVLILIQLSIVSILVSLSYLMSKSCNPLCTGINYTILRNSIKNSAMFIKSMGLLWL